MKNQIQNDTQIRKFDIYYVDLSPNIGSEQGGIRPCVIIQNDMGNKFSPTTLIAPCTTKRTKHKLPTHITFFIDGVWNCLLLEQIRSVDKQRLCGYIGTITNEKLQEKINKGIKISFAL